MTSDLPDAAPITPNPLPISYNTIFSALNYLFPDHSPLILAAIKKIIVITKDNQNFSTMGINKYGHLYISSKFWDQHMHNYDALCTVLFHELLHHVSGDVFNVKPVTDDKEYELRNMADLYAMDARINSFIMITRPDINPDIFLTSFYTPLEEQDCLFKILKPFSKFNLSNKEEKMLIQEYNHIYSSDYLENHKPMSDIVYDILKKRPKNKQNIVLIGLHGEQDSLSEEELKDAVVIDCSSLSKKDKQKIEDALKEAAKDGSSPTLGNTIKDIIVEQSAGAGKGSKLQEYLIAPTLEITEKFDLSRFKKLAFDNIFHNVRSQAREKVGSYSTVPYVPSKLFTSDIVKLAMNYIPTMFKTYKYTNKINKNLLPIYLDVSGSTMAYLPDIIKLIANVSNELDYVWGFSDFIHKHTIQDLQAGKIKSSGGTSFDCIIEHVIEQQFKHFVVITDGDGYTKQQGKLANVESVVTILFGYSNKNNYFSKNYDNTHLIEEVTV